MVPEQYQAAVEEARRIRREVWPEVRTTHACLYEAATLQLVLAMRTGLRTMIQAGTCQWPMMLEEEDDGVGATHFSYAWDLREAVPYIAQGKLPELHVWLAYRTKENPDGYIIDTTSGSWPERATQAGHSWTSLAPPDCLWATADELAALGEERGLGVNYQADMDACQCADAFAHHGIYGPLTDHMGAKWVGPRQLGQS